MLEAHLAHLLDSVDFASAAGALKEVESDAHGAPPAAKEVLDAASVEKVATQELDGWATAQILTANGAVVLAGGLVFVAAGRLKAFHVVQLALAASASVAAGKFLLAGVDGKGGAELRDLADVGREAELEQLVECFLGNTRVLASSGLKVHCVSK